MRVGHYNSQWVCQAWLGFTHYFLGQLENGGQQANEAWAFAETLDGVSAYALPAAVFASVFVLRDRFEDALPLLQRAMGMPISVWTGAAESLLAMGMALREAADSLAAFHAAEQCLRSRGLTRGFGKLCGLSWLLQGYCLLGRRADAAPWQDVTEPLVTNVGDYLVNFFPTRTMAGIAAACAVFCTPWRFKVTISVWRCMPGWLARN